MISIYDDLSMEALQHLWMLRAESTKNKTYQCQFSVNCCPAHSSENAQDICDDTFWDDDQEKYLEHFGLTVSMVPGLFVFEAFTEPADAYR